ncbi:hypothetical protein KDU71_10315 [Carboxylicivirga sediminis]|uniref:DUF2157 domain-containing protein n=1 Tax=Carboxylicivirga sediminis TaxID=2006564 RepID=A0A941IWP0_9BACT|nr:hypothetical protein [Carboxylicivirga sediminis]MBR8535951.1 hypothetical protein [Carboxylicivirga sediminis]
MKLSVSKKQGKVINEAIEHWHASDIIDDATRASLSGSVETRRFEWKKLAIYSFWISIVCVIISFSALVADELLMELIERFFTSSDVVLCLSFAAIASMLYLWAFMRQKRHPQKVFSNEFIVMIGILSTATAIAYLGKALDSGDGHFSVLFLIATIVYGCIGLLFPSKLVWVFAILSLGAWFGTETGYISGWGAYYLGMNYPLRFVVFGLALTALSFVFSRFKPLRPFQKSTYTLGLLYLFIALWILSIFGNYGDWDEWEQIKQISLFGWGLIFGLFAIAAIAYGLKFDDYTSRSFGITFLFINLYTKFFEYFWDATHKTIFFLILGFTFWLIGRNAEKIWNLEFLNKKEIKED